jgi:hypothetical protein
MDLTSNDSALPLHLASPIREKGFRLVFTENAKHFVSRFGNTENLTEHVFTERFVTQFGNSEPRKRSFEKSGDSERSPSTLINLS